MPYAATAASGRPSRCITEKTHFLRPFLVRAPVSVVRSQEIGKEITYEKGHPPTPGKRGEGQTIFLKAQSMFRVNI